MAFAQDPRILEMVGQSQFAGAIQGAMQSHIAEHMGFAYRQKIEEQMGVTLPPPGEDVPPEVEEALAKVEALAAQKVLQDALAKSSAQKAEAQAQDPLIQMQQAELQIKAQEAQRKAAKDAIDAQLAAEKLALDKERIDSAERIAGAKIMADFDTREKELDAKQMAEVIKASSKLMGGV
jgi:hypothetical protein